MRLFLYLSQILIFHFVAMVAFTKVSMKNLAGLLAAGVVLFADYTGMLDKLLESIIVTEGVKLQDFVIGDKNALLVSARIVGYG